MSASLHMGNRTTEMMGLVACCAFSLCCIAVVTVVAIIIAKKGKGTEPRFIGKGPVISAQSIKNVLTVAATGSVKKLTDAIKSVGSGQINIAEFDAAMKTFSDAKRDTISSTFQQLDPLVEAVQFFVIALLNFEINNTLDANQTAENEKQQQQAKKLCIEKSCSTKPHCRGEQCRMTLEEMNVLYTQLMAEK